MYSHPAVTPGLPDTPGYNFTPRLDIRRDPYYAAGMTETKPGLQLGHWWRLKSSEERITTQSLPIFADCYLPLVRHIREPELGDHDM